MDYEYIARKIGPLKADIEQLKTQERSSGGLANSIEGVSNAGGNIDLTVTGSGLTITGDNTANTINFDVSALATDAELAAHASNTSNPHSTTAAQVGALVSVGGVSNPGAGVTLSVTGSGLTITPNNTTKNIDFDVSNLATDAELAAHASNTSNPHATTALQVGAVQAQASTPGSVQSSTNFNISGKGKATQLEAVTTGSLTTAAYVASATGIALLVETTGAAGSSYPSLAIKSSASQTSEILQFQNSSGTRLGGVDKTGILDVPAIKIAGILFGDRVTSSMPASPSTGQICTRADLLYSDWYYNGAAWRQRTVPSINGTITMAGTPPTYMRVFREDRNRDYFYDGTRWLSCQDYSISYAPRNTQPFAQIQQIFDGPWVRPATQENGVYILDYSGVFIPSSAAQSATNYYGISFLAQTLSVNTTVSIVGVTNTQAATTLNARYQVHGTMNYYADNTYIRSQFVFDVNGTPGTFYCGLTLRYRLVG